MRSTLLVLTMLGATALRAQNDCATATPITPGQYHMAGFTGVSPVLFCAQNTQSANHGQWYSYTPTADHYTTVSTDLPQNVGLDTRVHIYGGPCNGLFCVAGDDDGGSGNTSLVHFDAIANTTYTIVFDDYWNQSAFDFVLSEANPIGPGNACGQAIAVTAGVYTVDSIVGLPPTLFCAATNPTAQHGVWYSYTPSADHSLTVTTDLPQNAGGDTRLHVYTGTCNAPVCKAGDDDSGSGNLATATFNVQAGITYLIVFDDYWSNAGFDFELIEEEPVPVPIAFTASTPLSGYPMGAVDMNGDHLDDVVIPGTASATVYDQESNGTLTPHVLTHPNTQHTASWSFCAGDIDKNGYTDMMYGSGGGASFFMANGDGTAFTEVSFPEYIFCQRTNMVDIDNDGDLDAFSCHDVDANVYFLNDGTGALTFHQGGLGPTCGNYGSIWVDYDNDRDMDLFIAKCGCDPVDLFMRNDGNLNFASIAAQNGFADSHQSWSSAWGDFDNDGDMDVLVGSSSSTVHKLMRNDGSGFTNVTAGSGLDTFNSQSIEWVTHDFNNDGYLDILGGYGFLLGHGDMTFTSVPDLPTNGPIGDLNNDGFLDIVTNNRVYLNDGNLNHWLTVSTVGTASNANGIGARVEITSAMGHQIRDVRSGDGFEYMSSLNTHFGLGADTVITDLVVYWPSGEITLLHDVPVDTPLVVVEGLSTDVPVVKGNSDLLLFPSPVESTLFVRGAENFGNRPVSVIDMAGKLVQRGTLRSGALDVSALSPGLYVLRLDGAAWQGRFVKQ